MSNKNLEELENSKFEVISEEEQQKIEGGSFRSSVNNIINLFQSIFN